MSGVVAPGKKLWPHDTVYGAAVEPELKTGGPTAARQPRQTARFEAQADRDRRCAAPERTTRCTRAAPAA